MAHRANAADARHQRRHLVERPVLAEFLEAAQLRDVQPRVRPLRPSSSMLHGDLGVAFDARHRIDDNSSATYCLAMLRTAARGLVCGGRPPSSLLKRLKNHVRRRWAAGDKHIHRHDLVHRPYAIQQATECTSSSEAASASATVSTKARVSTGFTPKGLRMPGMLLVTAQSPNDTRMRVCARTFLIFARSSSFETAPSTRVMSTMLGKILAIHQRAVDQIGLLRERDQPLVHIQKRHVAAGAAVQPHRGQRRLSIGALLILSLLA